MDNNNAMSELVKGVDYLVRQSFNSAPFDRTFIGIIKGIQGDTYTVQINDVEYKNIKSLQNGLSVYDIVKVVVPQNNMNNMFILGNSVSGGGGTSNGLTASFINNVYSLNGKVNGADTTLNLLKNGTLSSGTFSGTLHDSIKVDGSNVTNRAALFSSQITANPNFNGTLTVSNIFVNGTLIDGTDKYQSLVHVGRSSNAMNSEVIFRDFNRGSKFIFAGYANDSGTWYLYDQSRSIAMIHNVYNGNISFNGDVYNAISYIRARTLDSNGNVVSYSRLNNDGTIYATGNVTSDGAFYSNRSDGGFSQTHGTSKNKITFGIGSGGINRGIYDDTLKNWMIRRGDGTNGEIYFGGGLRPATTASYALGDTTHIWSNLYTEAIRLYRNTSHYFGFGGTPTANRTITFQNASGTVAFTSSDARLKENIKDTTKNGLDIINQIKVRQFDWKDNNDVGYNKGTHQDIGFIADELEKIDSRFIVNGSGGYNEDGTINPKCIDTFYLVGYLTKAVQELSEEINKLKESGELK